MHRTCENIFFERAFAMKMHCLYSEVIVTDIKGFTLAIFLRKHIEGKNIEIGKLK